MRKMVEICVFLKLTLWQLGKRFSRTAFESQGNIQFWIYIYIYIYNVPSHLHISWLNSNSFLHPFRLGGNRFSKISTGSFEWGTRPSLKMHRFNAFSRNVNAINWKFFASNGGIYKLEKTQQAFWRGIKL